MPPSLREVYTRLKQIWADEKNDRKPLNEKLEHFICTTLYRALTNNTSENGNKKHAKREMKKTERKEKAVGIGQREPLTHDVKRSLENVRGS
jgi:heterodisulfide reductase subunit C